MLNYRDLLFCLSVATITRSAVIDSIYQDVNAAEYYQYQVEPVEPENQEKVNVKIYYEVMCPDCCMFHTKPLREVMQKIGSYVDLKSYPYGFVQKSIVNGTTFRKCQHGIKECYGNKLDACAIDILNNSTRSELYNSCMMSRQWGGTGSTNMDATNCGKAMGIDAQPIIDCASGQKGEELFEYYGEETAKVPDIKNYGVPYVMINNIQFAEENDQFFSTVCKAFTNPPPPCSARQKSKSP